MNETWEFVNLPDEQFFPGNNFLVWGLKKCTKDLSLAIVFGGSPKIGHSWFQAGMVLDSELTTGKWGGFEEEEFAADGWGFHNVISFGLDSCLLSEPKLIADFAQP